MLLILNQVSGALKDGASGIASGLSGITALVNLLNTANNTSGANNAPKAYLNIIAFDDQFKYDATASTVIPVPYGPNAAGTISRLAASAITVAKSGFIYVYVSNESDELVYFDNFILTHEKGPILEDTHYYPFGLIMAGLSSKALLKTENKYKFNDGTELASKEFSDGAGLDWYETSFRSYDPQIGRFHQIDPLAEIDGQFSPYAFGNNNPILFNDPLGLWSNWAGRAAKSKTAVEGGDEPADNGAAPMAPVYVYAPPKPKPPGYRGPSDFGGGSGSNSGGGGDYSGRGGARSGGGNGGGATKKNGKKKVEVEDKTQNRFDLRGRLHYAGGLGNPSWFKGIFKDISSSNYPGIKVYETSLIADGSAVTLPGFGILIHPSIKNVDRVQVLQHEYGHFLDYKFSPSINYNPYATPNIPIVNFYIMIGTPSIFNAATGIGGDHEAYWTEVRANHLAQAFFGNTYISDPQRFPTKKGCK